MPALPLTDRMRGNDWGAVADRLHEQLLVDLLARAGADMKRLLMSSGNFGDMFVV